MKTFNYLDKTFNLQLNTKYHGGTLNDSKTD